MSGQKYRSLQFDVDAMDRLRGEIMRRFGISLEQVLYLRLDRFMSWEDRRKSIQDMQGKRDRYMLLEQSIRSFSLSRVQAIRGGLDSLGMSDDIRRVVVEHILNSQDEDHRAMCIHRSDIANRYGISLGQVLHNGLDNPLIEEDALGVLANQIKRSKVKRFSSSSGYREAAL